MKRKEPLSTGGLTRVRHTQWYSSVVKERKISVALVVRKHMSQKSQGSHKVENKTLKKAGVGQPKYCNSAYVHVVLTNLCSIFSIFNSIKCL